MMLRPYTFTWLIQDLSCRSILTIEDLCHHYIQHVLNPDHEFLQYMFFVVESVLQSIESFDSSHSTDLQF